MYAILCGKDGRNMYEANSGATISDAATRRIFHMGFPQMRSPTISLDFDISIPKSRDTELDPSKNPTDKGG